MSEGIGGYLMEAAQTFGDNLIGIFDRIGELAGGVASNITGAITGGAAAATVATVATASSGASTAVTSGAEAAASNIIMLPQTAISNLNNMRESSLSLEWASAERGEVLGSLARPDTPYVEMPDLGVGMAMA
jgi:hypothetical protein